VHTAVVKLAHNGRVAIVPQLESAEDFRRLRNLNDANKLTKKCMSGNANSTIANEVSSTIRLSKWL